MPRKKKAEPAVPVVTAPPEPKKVVAPVVEAPKRVLPEFNSEFERLFEAPDGTILVGAKDRETMIYRAGNGGTGQIIQPMR